MKKVLSILFALVMCVALSFTVFAAEDQERLYDGADLLTPAEESGLLDKLNRVSEAYKVDIIIATVDSVGDFSADAFVEKFYDDNALGYGTDRDGVLLLIAMKEREYRILSNGPVGAAAISRGDIETIGEEIVSDLGAGDYADAFHAFIDSCEYQIKGEINGFPFAFGKNLLISLGIGFLIALIVTGCMKSKLKSVRKQLNAKDYIKQGSMQLTSSKDLYLYNVVHREKIERVSTSSSGSSGSSGGRHVGGGKF